MFLKDVQTLNSSLYEFNFAENCDKDKLAENQIGYLTYGRNNKWIFDTNRYSETELICDVSTIDKVKTINDVLGSKLFTIKNVYKGGGTVYGEIDYGAFIQIEKSNESQEEEISFPENGSVVQIEKDEENIGNFYLSWGNEEKALIINSDKSNGENNIFSDAGDFKTVGDFYNFQAILDGKEITVVENNGQGYVLSIKGNIAFNFQYTSASYSKNFQGLEENDVGNIVISERNNGLVVIFKKHLVYTFQLSEKWREKELSNVINQGKVILSQIINISDEKLQLFVQQYDNYRNRRLVFKKMALRCSPELLKKLPKNEEHLFIRINNKNYFVCQIAESKNYVFTIYTKNLRIKVEKKLAVSSKIDGNKYVLNVKSVEKRNGGKNVIPNLSLVEGEFYFVDEEKIINDEINEIIDNLVKSKSSYLATWDKYAETRGNELLKTARDFGVLYYESISFDSGNKVSITLKNCLTPGTNLSDLDSFDIYENVSNGENLPFYMLKENKDMDWKAYYKATVKGAEDDLTEEQMKNEALVYDINRLAGLGKKGKDEKKSEAKKDEKKPIVSKIVPIKSYKGDNGEKIIEFNYPDYYKQKDFPEKGHIVLSILGEELQIKRQEKARRNISDGKNPMSGLRVLLEDQADISNLYGENKLKHEDLTPHISRKVFGSYGPNESQLEAIYTALESSDVAIIQGPPGTGKTTVIQAILEMFNLERCKTGNNQGLYLITSYQHDAVINLIDRLRLNGMPSSKYGHKKVENEDYVSNIVKYVEEISENQVKNYIKEKYGKTDEDFENISYEQMEDYKNEFYDSINVVNKTGLEELTDIYNKYETKPNNSNKIEILEKMNEVPGITFEDRKKIENLLKNTKKSLALNDNSDLLIPVRSLRVTAESYKDDGIERSKYLLRGENKEKIREIISQIEVLSEKSDFYMKVLEDSASEVKNNFSDFENLRKIQLLLIDAISEAPEYIKYHKDPEITELYHNVAKCFKIKPKDEKTRILGEWNETLQFNNGGIVEAVKKMDVAYAATAQQSVGKDITKAKSEGEFAASVGDLKNNYYYDVVVVDEAAKATPPDLLIPMSLGKSKIVLVGDHRQLPHLVDPKIANKVIEQEDFDNKDEFLNDNISKRNLEFSMFEILFNHFKKLEAKGDVKRVVTLNKQYRMHPALGNFASQQFYEPYGEGFESPLPKEKFSHKLPGIENKCAVWIDVKSNKDNKEKKLNNSLYRKSEAEAIIKKLKEWKESEGGKELTYGIITFYRAQANYISDMAKKDKELSQCIKDGTLRINTVDAFQGMEFDVVFLSVVRTSNGSKENKYGFLTSKNRLCVALTRQKKVLAICGDSQLLNFEDARDKENGIPALCDFYEDLCKGEDGVCL